LIQTRKAYITAGKKFHQAYTSANEKTRNAGGVLPEARGGVGGRRRECLAETSWGGVQWR